MRIKPSWVSGLPEVVGWWGFDEKTVVDSHIAVRKKGSKDETLFISTVLFYKSLYPNLAPRFKWEGGKIVEGPIFIKTDSGPGRNCKSERALKFQQDMQGVHLGPGLLNTTSCNQEMDDWFQDFKGKTDAQAQDIFEEKTYEYAVSLKHGKVDGETELKSAALTNDDIPRIINGLPDDYNFCLALHPRKFSRVGWQLDLFLLLAKHFLTRKFVTCLETEEQNK